MNTPPTPNREVPIVLEDQPRAQYTIPPTIDVPPPMRPSIPHASMASQTFKKLAALRSQLESLQSEADRELANIPKEYGFPDKESFLAAFHAATGGRPTRRGRPPGPGSDSPSDTSGKRRRRSKITPEMKQQLKDLVKEGKTGAQIAEQLKISLPSVANIKKELGLTKSRE